MVSQMCKEDIELMQEDGLKPTVDDIIRLNELALKFEKIKKNTAFKSLYLLPRVAQIDDKRWFRQPSLGHEIWLQSLSRYVNFDSIDTSLAVYAFALSRDTNELPAPENMKLVIDEINAYLETMKDVTKEQIKAAIEYCQDGVDSTVDVYPDYPKTDDTDEYDWDSCLAAGVLRDGIIYLHGVSVAELKSMTKSEVETMIEKTIRINNPSNDDGKIELGNYLRTLDNIKKRLKEEKDKDNK